MTLTETSTAIRTTAPVTAGVPSGPGTAGARKPLHPPVPVWFFAFEGLIGAGYDIIKSCPWGWIPLAVAGVVNLVLVRVVLRGRLRTAKAILKGRRTRKIAAGLIVLRIAVHLAFGAVGLETGSGLAHLAAAAGMCAATVALLAFEQRVLLRALNS